jgi:hypothetical protein
MVSAIADEPTTIKKKVVYLPRICNDGSSIVGISTFIPYRELIIVTGNDRVKTIVRIASILLDLSVPCK